MPDGVGTTHHVKIGDYHFLVRPFSYIKRPAPLFGARITTGDPDYNNLSIWQHWAQSCWVGGIDADQWVDDAMYDEAIGIDSTVHEQLTLSRDLPRATGGALNAGSLTEPRRFIAYRNGNLAANQSVLYCLTTPRTFADSYLWKFTQGTLTWSLVKTWAGKKAKSVTVFSGKLVVGFSDATLQHATDPTGAWTAVAAPAGETGSVTALQVYTSTTGGSKLYVAHANKVYRRDTAFALDGSAVFYDATDADEIVSMEVHLGYLYMLSRNARVHRTDGNNTFPIWGWDSNTIGTSLASYDGRLFLATYEYTDSPDLGIGVLYQFTGAAVTQLKRFGLTTRATTLGRMTVYDRRLWYGASGLWGMNKNAAGTDLGGFGVASYDAIEDSHCIWATNKDTTTYTDASGVGQYYHVDDVFFFQGSMHLAVRGHGNFRSEISYRDYLRDRAKYDTTTTAATGGSNQGFLLSSDYDAGTVGLQKLWRDVTVHADLASDLVTVDVDYSLDGGKTWVAAGTVSRTLTGTVTRTSGQTTLTGSGTKFLTQLKVGESIVVGADTRVVLAITSDTALTVTAAWSASGGAAVLKSAATRFVRRLPLQNVRGNRFKYRLKLNSSSTSYSPVVRGVVVSYLLLPEPNWQWEMTLVNSEKMTLLDGTTDAISAATKMDYLQGLFRSQEMFVFTELSGVTWSVSGNKGCILMDCVTTPVVATLPSASQPREGDVRVVILEAVESY